MSKTFLGKGWGFPVGLNTRGNIELSEYEKNIEESVILIVGTATGERVMRPEFGCKIHDLIFYPNNATTATLATFYIKEALAKWEPRVEDVDVRAFPDPSSENVMLIDIHYKVIKTNNLHNIVYPFYLRREQ
jgi:phage baseplate assembly protein W